MKYILLTLILISCGSPEYSPWQDDPNKPSNLTQRHLDNLKDLPFKPFTVALTADPQVVIGHMDDVRKSVNRTNAEFSLIMGDLTDRGLMREWNWLTSVISRFDKPVLTVVGNHDGIGRGQDIYSELFGNYNYSFIYRDIKFVAWNNNVYEWGAPDLDWLEKQIESHDRVVVFSHQPPHSDTLTSSQRARWKEIRHSPNLIASIHGHTHTFSYHIEKDTEVPIYIAERVKDNHFGLIRIEEDGVKFFNCYPDCREAK